MLVGLWCNCTRCGVSIPQPGFNSRRLPNTTWCWPWASQLDHSLCGLLLDKQYAIEEGISVTSICNIYHPSYIEYLMRINNILSYPILDFTYCLVVEKVCWIENTYFNHAFWKANFSLCSVSTRVHTYVVKLVGSYINETFTLE